MHFVRDTAHPKVEAVRLGRFAVAALLALALVGAPAVDQVMSVSDCLATMGHERRAEPQIASEVITVCGGAPNRARFLMQVPNFSAAKGLWRGRCEHDPNTISRAGPSLRRGLQSALCCSRMEVGQVRTVCREMSQ